MNKKKLRIGLVGLFTVLFLALVLAFCLTRRSDSESVTKKKEKSNNTVIFVSVDGSDETGDGSKENPYGTLQKAQEVVRALSEKERGKGVTVNVREGTYTISDPLDFDGMDNGSKEHPVVWQAYKDEKVLLSGKTTLNNDDFVLATESEDAEVYKLLQDSVKGKVYVYDLDLLLDEDDEIPTLPTSYANKSEPIENIFLDGESAKLARWPDAEYTGNVKVENAQIYASPTSDILAPKEMVGKSPKAGIMTYRDERIDKWALEDDPYLMGYFRVSYFEEPTKAVIKPETNTLQTGNVLMFGIADYVVEGMYASDTLFYGYNLVCELDNESEYYIDRRERKLYIYDEDNDLSDRTVEYGVSKAAIIQMGNAGNITISGFKVEAATASGINVKKCDNILVEDCTVYECGNAGIIVAGNNNTVRGCNVYGVGGGGISITGGDNKTLERGNNLVEHCTVTNVGTKESTSNGISVTGVGNTARGNLVYDTKHTGIEFGGCYHVIENNELYGVCQDTSDSGAIYCGGSWMYRGNTIRYNYVHDCITESVVLDIYGIYLDDSISDIECYGNVVVNISGVGFHVANGRDHDVKNNLVINCDEAWALSDRAPRIDKKGEDTNVSAARWLRAGDYKTGKLWLEAFPELEGVYVVSDVESEEFKNPKNLYMPDGTVIKDNVLVNTDFGSCTDRFKTYAEVEFPKQMTNKEFWTVMDRYIKEPLSVYQKAIADTETMTTEELDKAKEDFLAALGAIKYDKEAWYTISNEEELYSALRQGGKYYLAKDIEVTSDKWMGNYRVCGKNVSMDIVLDLNGYSINFPMGMSTSGVIVGYCGIFFECESPDVTFTLRDSSSLKTGCINNLRQAFIRATAGTFNLEGGSINMNQGNILRGTATSEAVFNVYEGNFKTGGAYDTTGITFAFSDLFNTNCIKIHGTALNTRTGKIMEDFGGKTPIMSTISVLRKYIEVSTAEELETQFSRALKGEDVRIRLMSNIVSKKMVLTGKNAGDVYLDLNGHTITVADGNDCFVEMKDSYNGTVTLAEHSNNRKGKIISNQYIFSTETVSSQISFIGGTYEANQIMLFKTANAKVKAPEVTIWTGTFKYKDSFYEAQNYKKAQLRIFFMQKVADTKEGDWNIKTVADGYAISVEVVAGKGTVTPEKYNVYAGDSIVVTVTPYGGYEVASVEVNGQQVQLTDGTFKIENIKAKQDIVVAFEGKPYQPISNEDELKNALTNGGWYYLTKDIEIKKGEKKVDYHLYKDEKLDITIDLNGFDIDVADYSTFINCKSSNVTFTLRDSSSRECGSVTGLKLAFTNSEAGTFNFEGGNIVMASANSNILRGSNASTAKFNLYKGSFLGAASLVFDKKDVDTDLRGAIETKNAKLNIVGDVNIRKFDAYQTYIVNTMLEIERPYTYVDGVEKTLSNTISKGNVRLSANIETESIVVTEKTGDIYLDLNGYTITVLSGELFVIEPGYSGTITIADHSESQSGLICADTRIIRVSGAMPKIRFVGGIYKASEIMNFNGSVSGKETVVEVWEGMFKYDTNYYTSSYADELNLSYMKTVTDYNFSDAKTRIVAATYTIEKNAIAGTAITVNMMIDGKEVAANVAIAGYPLKITATGLEGRKELIVNGNIVESVDGSTTSTCEILEIDGPVTIRTADMYNVIIVTEGSGKVTTQVNNGVGVYNGTNITSVSAGSNLVIEVNTLKGYNLDSVVVDGQKVALTGGKYTLANIVKDAEVEIRFKGTDYQTITNEAELKKALENGGRYYLTRDLELVDGESHVDYKSYKDESLAVTIDLNGFHIHIADCSTFINCKSSNVVFTLQDSSALKSGSITGPKLAFTNSEAGTFNFEGGSIQVEGANVLRGSANSQATFNFYEGIFKAYGNLAYGNLNKDNVYIYGNAPEDFGVDYNMRNSVEVIRKYTVVNTYDELKNTIASASIGTTYVQLGTSVSGPTIQITEKAGNVYLDLNGNTLTATSGEVFAIEAGYDNTITIADYSDSQAGFVESQTCIISASNASPQIKFVGGTYVASEILNLNTPANGKVTVVEVWEGTFVHTGNYCTTVSYADELKLCYMKKQTAIENATGKIVATEYGIQSSAAEGTTISTQVLIGNTGLIADTEKALSGKPLKVTVSGLRNTQAFLVNGAIEELEADKTYTIPVVTEAITLQTMTMSKVTTTIKEGRGVVTAETVEGIGTELSANILGVSKGSDVKISVTVASGYQVKVVKVAGKSVKLAKDGTYVIQKVEADTEVTVAFERNIKAIHNESELEDALTQGGRYYLAQDITIEAKGSGAYKKYESDEKLEIILDLNGFSIDCGDYDALVKSNSSDVTFTLQDSSALKTGRVNGVGVSPIEYTSSVGSYDELLAAVQDKTIEEKHIKLSASFAVSSRIFVEEGMGDIYLDLNGYALTISDDRLFDVRTSYHGTITMADHSEEQTGAIHCSAYVLAGGNINMKVIFIGGTYVGNHSTRGLVFFNGAESIDKESIVEVWEGAFEYKAGSYCTVSGYASGWEPFVPEKIKITRYSIENEKDLKAALERGGEYYLTSDISIAGDGWQPTYWTYSGSAQLSLTLDLNGYTISFPTNASNVGLRGDFINCSNPNVTITICDSSSEKTGTIANLRQSVVNASAGNFYFRGGNIVMNQGNILRGGATTAAKFHIYEGTYSTGGAYGTTGTTFAYAPLANTDAIIIYGQASNADGSVEDDEVALTDIKGKALVIR